MIVPDVHRRHHQMSQGKRQIWLVTEEKMAMSAGKGEKEYKSQLQKNSSVFAVKTKPHANSRQNPVERSVLEDGAVKREKGEGPKQHQGQVRSGNKGKHGHHSGGAEEDDRLGYLVGRANEFAGERQPSPLRQERHRESGNAKSCRSFAKEQRK